MHLHLLIVLLVIYFIFAIHILLIFCSLLSLSLSFLSFLLAPASGLDLEKVFIWLNKGRGAMLKARETNLGQHIWGYG